MLPSLPSVAEPYLLNGRMGPQVIDVPVMPERIAQVMAHTGANASGAKRTSDINVEPGLEAHTAKSPDPDFGIRG